MDFTSKKIWQYQGTRIPIEQKNLQQYYDSHNYPIYFNLNEYSNMSEVKEVLRKYGTIRGDIIHTFPNTKVLTGKCIVYLDLENLESTIRIPEVIDLQGTLMKIYHPTNFKCNQCGQKGHTDKQCKRVKTAKAKKQHLNELGKQQAEINKVHNQPGLVKSCSPVRRYALYNLSFFNFQDLKFIYPVLYCFSFQKSKKNNLKVFLSDVKNKNNFFLQIEQMFQYLSCIFPSQLIPIYLQVRNEEEIQEYI